MARRSVAVDAAAIETLRAQRGWEQTDLAEHAGVSASTISRMERASPADTFDAQSAGRVATALGVPLDAVTLGPTRLRDRVGRVADKDRDLGLRNELEQIRAALGLIGQRLGAGPVPWISTGIAPTTPARLLERAVGTVQPMIVQDDLLAADGLRAGSVAWVDPTGVGAEGKIICVGAGERARLKRYEPGDEVSGVVVLVQYSPP